MLMHQKHELVAGVGSDPFILNCVVLCLCLCLCLYFVMFEVGFGVSRGGWVGLPHLLGLISRSGEYISVYMSWKICNWGLEGRQEKMWSVVGGVVYFKVSRSTL